MTVHGGPRGEDGAAPGYLMDHPAEARRLRDKVDAAAWVARYLPATAPGGHLLEVGCGPLHLLEVAADRCAAGLAVGVDLSRPRLQQGRAEVGPGGPAPVVAEAATLPFADGSFDTGYTRFLLQYHARPQQVVDELARVVRPGGTVLLQDLDGQLVEHYPEDRSLAEDLGTVLAALEGRLDVHVGRKLFTLARRSGLDAVRVELEAYHLVAGSADAGTMDLWQRKLDIAMPAVVRVLGPLRAESARRRFLARLEDPDGITFSTLFTVTGRVPAGPPAARCRRGAVGLDLGPGEPATVDEREPA